MNKVHFILGVHNHQPIGNFDFVFEKAYTQAYLPFLEVLERHPTIQWNMHATGILWEWLEKHHPDYIERVAEQVKAGRLEILTGGYYEPILPALPDADKSGQIQKLSRYLRQRFKTKPRGMWLAERVWEPHLVKVLADNEIDYTLVDDTHFLSTGLAMEDMSGAYLSEEQGATLRVLPIRQDLRYAIPFKDSGETLNILRQYASPSGHKALVMFDDGEKFGLWPETNAHVYEGGWLEKFLTVLESNKDWIVTSRISDYLSAHMPLGRVYLPTASYSEMGEWSLPAPAQEALLQFEKHVPPEERAVSKRFVHGGFWRNFLTKYEEANNIHKKMLRVSEKVHRALDHKTSVKALKTLDALWSGQCNCAYWHGVFGGLYLPHLRQALYRELLAAESQADKILDGDKINVRQDDFDKDGSAEVLVESPAQNLYLSPASGGSLFEWDLRKEGINLGNVLTRRQEGYHRQLLDYASHPSSGDSGHVKTIHDLVRVKEPGLEKRLFVDWYRRTSLLDHFLHPNTTIENFFHCQYGEQGDFVKSGYQVDIVEDKYPQIRLSRLGSVWTGDQKNMVSVEKTLSLTNALGWQVVYRIQNVHGPACQLWFGCEMNLAFSSQDKQDPVESLHQTQWLRTDHGYGMVLSVQFDLPVDLWEFPLETVSLSEEGFERTYQGTVLLAHSKIALQPGQVWASFLAGRGAARMNFHKLIVAAMWAGVISLDFTACGPFMVSQPLVCGPLFGWLMGQVAVGVILGGIVQLLWMDLSPVGVGIPYDATAVTVLAVYWATRPGNGALSQLVLALALAVPFGFLFRWLDQLARRLNTRIMHQIDQFSDETLPFGLWLGVGGGIAWSWIRYTLAYGLTFALGELIWRHLAYSPRLTPADQGLTMAIILLPVAGMGVTLELFLSEEPEGRWSVRRKGSKKDLE